MQNGLTGGALQLGLSFATQGLDPLVGGLVSSAATGAIDGLIAPADPLKPLGERKGIFSGITDTLKYAVGGFTEIGLIKPGDPFATAQGLAKLNDFTTIIREQGLGAAVETYATGLLYRSSVESLIHAGNSLSIRQTINAQLQNPLLVELEGRQTVQINLGGNNHLWVDPTSHAIVASLQGQDYIRYGKILVDPNTKTLGVPDATIQRTIKGPDGITVTAQFLEEISAGGVVSFKLYDKAGILWTIDRNNLREIRLNADGTIRDGTLTNQATGAKLTFLPDGSFKIQKPVQVVKEQDGTYISVGQTTVEETRNPGGKLVGLVAQAIGDIDKLGLLSVQTGAAENGVAFVDQQGRIQMAYKGNFIVIGHSTKFLELADTVVSFYPQGAPIPTANFRPVWLKDEAVSTLQDPASKQRMANDFIGAQDFVLKSGVSRDQIAAEFITTPKIDFSQKVVKGVTRTSSFDLRVISPDSPTADNKIAWGPLHGFTGTHRESDDPRPVLGLDRATYSKFVEVTQNSNEDVPNTTSLGVKASLKLSDDASDPSRLGVEIKWVQSDVARGKMTFIITTSVTTDKNPLVGSTGNLAKASSYEKISFDESDAAVPSELKEMANSFKTILNSNSPVPIGPLPIPIKSMLGDLQVPQVIQGSNPNFPDLRTTTISLGLQALLSYAQQVRGFSTEVRE